MVEVEPGFRVRSPGMLHFEKQIPQQLHVGIAANLPVPFPNPLAAQPADFPIARDLQGIAANAVNPGVANFLRDRRKSVHVRRDFVRHGGEICWHDFCIGKPRLKDGVSLLNFFRRVRARIVVSHHDRDAERRAGNHGDGAIPRVIHHGERCARRVRPTKEGGENGRPAGFVDSDIEKRNAIRREWGDEPTCVSGHVGHFGASGFCAETSVERLRDPNRARDQRGVHQFGLPGEWQRVPRDVTGLNGLLHFLALLGTGLFEILVEQPRTGSPYVTWRAGVAERSGGFNGFGKKFIEVTADHVRLRVNKAGVKMAFEDDEDALDVGIGGGRPLRQEAPMCGGWIGAQQATTGGEQVGDKAATKHSGRSPLQVSAMES